MVPRPFSYTRSRSSSCSTIDKDFISDGGDIRLVDSAEKSTSCFESIVSFFKTRQPIELDQQDEKQLGGLVAPMASAAPQSQPTPPPVAALHRFDSSLRLSRLRSLMKEHKISVYIVPSEDEHQSEYTSPKDQRREFISGFTGSAGVAVIALNKAALSTDGRYFLQAGRQLDSNWTLLKQGVKGVVTWQEWCVQQALESPYRSVSVDPRLISSKLGDFFKEKCFVANLSFSPLMENLMDRTMQIEGFVPSVPKNDHIFVHGMQFAGEHATDKIERVRQFLREKNAFALVVSQLDEVAWLLNLRGSSIPYSPVFFAYCVVKLDDIALYLDKSKLTPEVTEYLGSLPQVRVLSYSLFWDDLPGLTNTVKGSKSRTVFLANSPNYALYMSVPSTLETRNRSIITELKGVKNSVEIKGHRAAQLRDSIALARTLAWLDETLHQPGNQVDEIEAATKAAHYRSQLPHFKGLSFETISSTGSNSSVIHYSPTPDSYSVIDPHDIYLLDSGAQYLDGTTDITRTLHFNKPTPDQIEKYTLVLKGHLNVAMLKFKQGTPSTYIDSLARRPLAERGLGYNHGTGHGIDTFILVHSGPCGLSPIETSYNYLPLEPGNFLSDEPGYYKDNEYGVRIESDLLVVGESIDADGNNVLAFEYLTLVPFCRRLIDVELLEPEQVEWIDGFHGMVNRVVGGSLRKLGDTRAVEWLERETRSLMTSEVTSIRSDFSSSSDLAD